MQQLALVYGATPVQQLDSAAARELMRARQEVATVADAAWRAAVRRRDPVELLRPHLGLRPTSRAFFKLAEMERLLPPTATRVALLCEAPGGFCQAARQLYPTAELFASSLERTDTDNERHRGEAPAFGATAASIGGAVVVRGLPSGGDVREPEVGDELVRRVGAHACALVTADGGAPTTDLDAMEQASLPLLLGQVALGLRLVAAGGTFVVKVFEGSTRPTRDVASLLRTLFADLHVFKPRCSKAANSERYLIAHALASEAHADATARVLVAALRRPHVHVHALLATADDEIGRAFDELARRQTDELRSMIAAARTRAWAKLERLATDDARHVGRSARGLACAATAAHVKRGSVLSQPK